MSHNEPPIVIEIKAPIPPMGSYWCATCALLYWGCISEDPDLQANTRIKVEHALEVGERIIDLKVPEVWHKKLRRAITIAPSVYFRSPMPVCWIHLVLPGLLGGSSEMPEPSPLIRGKAHGTEQFK